MGEGIGIRSYPLLLILCLILYALGLASIPPIDRDEPRFAQATRQMLETGDFVRIRFQHEERNKKPIGIHWLQAASVALLSRPESSAIWPYRLPSALAAIVAVLLTSAFGATLLSSRPAGFVAMASKLPHYVLPLYPALALLVGGTLAEGGWPCSGRAVRLPAALVLPELDALWLSRSAALLLSRHPPRPGEGVISVGYNEPSHVLLLGTATRLVTAEPGDGQLGAPAWRWSMTATTRSFRNQSRRGDSALEQSIARPGSIIRPVAAKWS